MVNLPKTEGKKVEGALSVCGECGSEQQAGGVSCGDESKFAETYA